MRVITRISALVAGLVASVGIILIVTAQPAGAEVCGPDALVGLSFSTATDSPVADAVRARSARARRRRHDVMGRTRARVRRARHHARRAPRRRLADLRTGGGRGLYGSGLWRIHQLRRPCPHDRLPRRARRCHGPAAARPQPVRRGRDRRDDHRCGRVRARCSVWRSSPSSVLVAASMSRSRTPERSTPCSR